MRLPIIAASILSLAATAAFGASMITDPGFEDPSKFIVDGNGVGQWEPFSSGGSATSLLSSTAPRTGSSHAQLTLGSANQFAGVFEDISVVPGESLTIDLWHSAINNSPTAIEIRIEWLPTSSGTEISRTPNSRPSPGATYENFSLTAVAPAGAGIGRVVYAVQSFAGSTNAQINIDDLTVNGSAIPEPSGTILLALGALGLMARRKRS